MSRFHEKKAMKKKMRKLQTALLVCFSILCGCLTFVQTMKAEELTSSDVNLLKEKASNGDAEAQAKLGKWYCSENSTFKEYEFAESWFRKSAVQGNAQGEFGLGTLYFFGRGVKQDYSKAIEWISKAAEQDDAIAQCTLGRIYYDGIGISKNLTEAYKWFELSSRHDSALAIRCLDITASHMKPAELLSAKQRAATYTLKSKEVKVVLNSTSL